MSFIRRTWESTKRVYRKALDERASPREIGWAVAIGVLIGCSPALGLHGWLALGAATALRKNRLFCWLGSRVCNVLTLPFVILAEIETARLIRTGHLVALDRSTILEHAPSLIGDWFLGLVPVGGVLAVTLGLGAFAVASLRFRRAESRKLARIADSSHNHPHEPSER